MELFLGGWSVVAPGQSVRDLLLCKVDEVIGCVGCGQWVAAPHARLCIEVCCCLRK